MQLQSNKAPWAPSGFKVSLSLVDYGVNNFLKGFIDRKSCNERKDPPSKQWNPGSSI